MLEKVVLLDDNVKMVRFMDDDDVLYKVYSRFHKRARWKDPVFVSHEYEAALSEYIDLVIVYNRLKGVGSYE